METDESSGCRHAVGAGGYTKLPPRRRVGNDDNSVFVNHDDGVANAVECVLEQLLFSPELRRHVGE